MKLMEHNAKILGDKMAKRFRFNGDTHILDTETNKQFYAPSENELLDLLNSLSDENGQLKQELSIREDQIQQITVAAYTDQYKEAEKYRKKFIRVCDELAEDEITIGNLKRENEKLKERIKELGAK